MEDFLFQRGLSLFEEKTTTTHIDKGREEEKIKIARNLLESGLSLDLVIKTTGLSKATIKELQSKTKS